MSLIVPRTAFVIESEVLGSFTRPADSGRAVRCVFCTECGTRIVHEPQYETPIVNVRAGTLDETNDLFPIAHAWLKSAQRWFEVPDGTLRYDEQPSAEDFIADMKALRATAHSPSR